jgi:hypothetical protein
MGIGPKYILVILTSGEQIKYDMHWNTRSPDMSFAMANLRVSHYTVHRDLLRSVGR